MSVKLTQQRTMIGLIVERIPRSAKGPGRKVDLRVGPENELERERDCVAGVEGNAAQEEDGFDGKLGCESEQAEHYCHARDQLSLLGRQGRSAEVRRTRDKAVDPDRVDRYVVLRHLANDALIRQTAIWGGVNGASVRLQGGRDN